jgi:hypothetical protein
MNRPVLLLALGAISFGLAAPTVDETNEPSRRFELDIDGKQYQLVSGEPAQLKIRGKKYTVQVAPLPTKRLELEQLSFDYPQDMEFSFMDATVMQSWTLTGDNASLTLHRVDGMSAKELQKTLLGTFGTTFKATKFGQKPSSLRIAGKAVKGVASRWSSGPITLHYEMFPVNPKGSKQFLFMLQCTLVDGEPTAELAHLRELIGSSLEYAK